MRAAKAPPETEPPSDASQPNVFYLGRAGAVHLHGLTVTYLDGLYDVDAFELPPPPDAGDACSHHTQLDVDTLRKSMRGEAWTSSKILGSSSNCHLSPQGQKKAGG